MAFVCDFVWRSGWIPLFIFPQSFHSGAGIDGGSRLDTLLSPDFLLSQDNIVVHLEYRVLLLGFLNLGFGEYTGNMGVKDQQLGLKWIHENIENFSGKRNEIMIFGGSAGTFLVLQKTFNCQIKW